MIRLLSQLVLFSGAAYLSVPVSPWAPARIAQSAGPATVCPDSSGYFEDPTITTFITFATPTTWNAWSMVGAGIARNGFGPATNLAAPEGSCAAFVTGSGAIQTSFTFPAGVSRLRFRAAQQATGIAHQQTLRVSMGGTQVMEDLIRSTKYEVYLSRPMVFAAPTNVSITVQGLALAGSAHTALIDRFEVEPIAVWNSVSTSTWLGGTIPGPADEVLIPSGVAVALTGSPTVRGITVNGELLVPLSVSPHLTADWLAVIGTTARFEVGQPRTTHQQNFRLTLTGNPAGPSAHGAGSKFLMSKDGGTLELHGRSSGVLLADGRRRAWTRLSQDVLPGSPTLRLEQAVNWQVGDRIVIAGSNYGGTNEAEVATITAIAVNGQDVTLSAGVTYRHSGSTVPVGLKTMSTRAEVGLLTHNVIVEGDSASSQSGDGAHVMMMLMRGACCTSGRGGIGRFSSVEFRRMGQRGRMGRYPLHWHLLEAQGSSQYAKWCSVHESFNRAMTIHGSDYVELEGNVLYDHLGHGVFLEDGGERNNRIYHNFALLTRKPLAIHALLTTDYVHDETQNKSPATFWITNPSNSFVGNVAAGTVGTGFWMALPLAPLNASATLPYFAGVQPNFGALGAFADNVCHSSGNGFDFNDGLDVNDNLVPNFVWVPPGSAPIFLDGGSVYGCLVGLYTGAGYAAYERLRFRNWTLSDNGVNIALANDAMVINSSICARTQTVNAVHPIVAAYLTYDGPGRVYDSHFQGFSDLASHFFLPTAAASRNTNHRFRGLTFSPGGPPVMLYNSFLDPQAQALDSSTWGFVALDEDGSLVGAPAVPSPGVTIIPTHPMLTNNLMAPLPSWGQPDPLLYVSLYQYGHLRIRHVNLAAGVAPPITFTRTLVGHAPVSFTHNNGTWDHRQIPVVVNLPGPSQAEYRAYWAAYPLPSPVDVVLDDFDHMPVGTHLAVELRRLTQSAAPMVTFDGAPAVQVGSFAALMSSTTSCYWVDTSVAEGSVWVRFVRTGREHYFRIQ